MDESRHAAIVLAAGGSRRLGRAKQLLTREGEPLVRRALRLAAATRPRRLILVLGAHAAAVRAAAQGAAPGVEEVENPDWSQGLASSLQCGVAALAGHTGPCLVLGCDQPALEAAHLQRLVDAASASASGCAATRYGDALGMPVLASVMLLRETAYLRGDRGLRAALNAIAHDAIGTVDAPALAFDLDTPEDVARALVEGWIDVPPEP
jgi:molybdenum cofactor cytidylyltransferase